MFIAGLLRYAARGEPAVRATGYQHVQSSWMPAHRLHRGDDITNLAVRTAERVRFVLSAFDGDRPGEIQGGAHG